MTRWGVPLDNVKTSAWGCHSPLNGFVGDAITQEGLESI